MLVSLLAARAQKIKELKVVHPFTEDGVLLSKLVAYCSREAHSCVEKAAMIAFTKLRILEADEDLSLRGATLAKVFLLHFLFDLNMMHNSIPAGHRRRSSFRSGPIFRLGYVGNYFMRLV